MSQKKMTILGLHKKKREEIPITMITAYDYPTAQLVDEAGIDMILVGDSLAMVVLGHDSTVAVTMDEMIHHGLAVRRGASNPFVVIDMPFLSYQVSVPDTLANAGRLIKETGLDAVKMEGAGPVVEMVRATVAAGMPTMGHLGLTPQTATMLGGFKVQGKSGAAAQKLVDDALALQDAGAFAIVLEAIPTPVADEITKRLTIPTIGIGAGAGCDGQVLVFHDMLGLFDRFTPKFVKRYAEMRQPIIDAFRVYREEVQARTFPDADYSYGMKEEQQQIFLYGDKTE